MGLWNEVFSGIRSWGRDFWGWAIGTNPLTQGIFFLADIAAPGPGEFGQGARTVRACQKLGDQFFDPDLQLAEARAFFRSLELGPKDEEAPAVSTSSGRGSNKAVSGPRFEPRSENGLSPGFRYEDRFFDWLRNLR